MIQRISSASREVPKTAVAPGQMVIGNYYFQTDPVHGAMLRPKTGDDQLALRPRPTPIALRPAMIEGFLDRADEIAQARAALAPGECLEIAGPEGTGKTALLIHLAHHLEGEHFPDGVIYRRVSRHSARDIQQTLFDAFHTGELPFRPSEDQVRHALQKRQAVILLDDVELDPRGLESLMNALPRCALVIAHPGPRVQEEGRAISLAGLPLGDAVRLLEGELGEGLLAADELPVAQQLCQALGRHPLRIRQAAALVREDGRPLHQLAARLSSGEPFAEMMLESVKQLSAGEHQLLGALAALDGAAITANRVADLSGLPNTGEVLESLRRRALVEEADDQYRLCGDPTETVRKKVSPEWTIKLILFYRHLAEKHRNAPAQLISEQETMLRILQWVRRARLWADALAIARRLDPALALAGRWDAWGQVLDWAYESARNLEDRRGEAWVLHEQGVRALCLENAHTAKKLLAQALHMRESQGDTAGTEATRHNLTLAENMAAAVSDPFAASERRGPLKRAASIALGLATLLLVVLAGVAWFGPYGARGQPAAPSPPIQLAAFSVPSAEVAGGQSVTATIRLNQQTPPPGAVADSANRAVVEIVAEDPHLVTVPRTVRLAPEESVVTFPIQTKPVVTSQRTKITALHAGVGRELVLRLRPELTLDLAASSTFGNRILDGQVGLKAQAPAGGLRITLACTDPSALTLPAEAVIPEGRRTGVFEIQTRGVSSVQKVDIIASLEHQTQVATLTVQPGPGWILVPPSIVSGQTVPATVFLGHSAPTGGSVVQLRSSDPHLLQVPETVTVPDGRMHADVEVKTARVIKSQTVTLSVEQAGISDRVWVKLRPPRELTSRPAGPATEAAPPIILRPASEEIVGGESAAVTIDLGDAVTEAGAMVSLKSSDPVAVVPPVVAVPPSKRSARFTLQTRPVGRTEQVTLQARVGERTGQEVIRVRPKFELQLQQIQLLGGQSTEGRLTLSGGAPPEGAEVHLLSSAPEILSVPDKVLIPSGHGEGYFVVRSSPVGEQQQPTITARYEDREQTRTVNLQADFQLAVADAGPTADGQPQGTIRLSGPAPADGVTIELKSNADKVANVPSEVFVPPGAVSANFSIQVSELSQPQTVVLVASSRAGIKRSIVLTVRGPNSVAVAAEPDAAAPDATASDAAEPDAAAPDAAEPDAAGPDAIEGE
jgi:DNA polymerase III delta prime subunit